MNRTLLTPFLTLVLCLVGLPSWLSAQSITLADSATLAQSTTRATLKDLVTELERANPELGSGRREIDMRVARIAPAGALADPTLSAGFMTGLAHAPFFLAPDADNSFRMFGVSQEFPYPGKRSLKTNIATTEADAERWNFESTRRRLVSDLKGAYFEYVSVTRSLAVLARNKDRLDQFRQIAEARFSVGKAIQQDVIKAQLEVSLLIERQAMLEQQQTSLRAAINGLLYRQPEASLDVTLDYERTPLLRTVEELHALAQRNNPMLKRDERVIDRGQQALALAKRDVLPDFAVNVTTQQMAGGMPWMYGVDVMVKVPLYWQRKQRPMIAEAAASLESGKKLRENTLSQTLAQVTATYAMATTSNRLSTLYGDSVLPQARLALESSLASYQVGNADFLTVLTNFVTVLNYEITYEEQNARYHEALARLEPLVGADLIR
jgi:cobalt-zinc-cadmium efflux system outer membrane protein